MYQKSSDLRKYLIISIYIDFLRFYFPFFCIHWLMGDIHVSFPYMKRIRIQKTMKINGCNTVQSNEFIQTEQN